MLGSKQETAFLHVVTSALLPVLCQQLAKHTQTCSGCMHSDYTLSLAKS